MRLHCCLWAFVQVERAHREAGPFSPYDPHKP